MRVHSTPLPGVVVVEPAVHGDHRGFFVETFHAARYAEAGLPTHFVQDNHSRSRRGTLRGLHYQEPAAQGKLVRVATGRVFDVAVDIRRGSPTFGRWFGVELSADDQRQLYVPPGFAHGFCVLSEEADFLYKCTAYYAPQHERSIRWDDPAIGIAWPIREPLLSPRDRDAPPLAEAAVLPSFRP